MLKFSHSGSLGLKVFFSIDYVDMLAFKTKIRYIPISIHFCYIRQVHLCQNAWKDILWLIWTSTVSLSLEVNFFQIFQFQNYLFYFSKKIGYNGGHHEEGYSSDLYMLQCANHNCQWSYLNQRLSVGRAYAAAIALPDSYAQCG